MDPLEEALSHLVPAVIIDIKSAALRYEEQRVGSHHRPENAREICEESRIKCEEGKNDDPAQERREGICCQADLYKVVRELIILPSERFVLGNNAEVLHDHTEDR